MPAWIWEQADWPTFHWRETEISPVLSRARLAQGRILGAVDLLDLALTLDADVSILVEDGVQTSAIEGERLDLDAVRSSVAPPAPSTGSSRFCSTLRGDRKGRSKQRLRNSVGGADVVPRALKRFAISGKRTATTP